MLSLQSLPTEILIKIFRFVDHDMKTMTLKEETLRNLTTVSNRFNEIINGDKILIGNFVLRLKPRSLNDEWIGSRKYQNLMIYNCSDEVIESFLENLKTFAEEVTSLTIWLADEDPKLKASSVAGILNVCSNLKSIINFPAIEGKYYDGEIPKLNLDHLGVVKTTEIGLKILSKTQTKRAKFLKVHEENIRKFLADQKSLSDLSISFNYDLFPAILDQYIETNFTFPLQSLKLNGHFWVFNEERFTEFLRNHSKTLEKIDMHTMTPLRILNNFVECENLKKLKIYQSHLLQYPLDVPRNVLRSVMELELIFHQKIEFDIAEIFPNLRKLRLENWNGLFVHPFSELPKLEELHLDRVKMREFPKTLKVLGLKRVNFKKMPIFDESSKIEEIEINKCANLSWLKVFLKINKVQLKSINLYYLELRKPEALAIRYQIRNFGNVYGEKIELKQLPDHLKKEMKNFFV